MSERTCKGCGATFRKGRRRMLFGAPGLLESTIVCVSCADRALCIVAPLVAPVTVTKVVGDPQLSVILKRLRAYRDAELAASPSMHSEYFKGRISGLEVAIKLVQDAREGRPL